MQTRLSITVGKYNVNLLLNSAMYSFIYSTAIGLRVKDGVVLAVEKLVQSKLLVAGANRRIQSADLHVGIVRKKDVSP